MNFSKLQWSILIVLALVLGYINNHGRPAEMLGYAMAFFLISFIFLYIPVGLAGLFKKRVSARSQRIIFISVYGLCVLSAISSMSKRGVESWDESVKKCMEVAKKKGPKDIEKKIDLKKYCDCALGKVVDKNLDSSSLVKIMQDKNSVSYNELIMTCISSALLSEKHGNLLGLKSADTIPVISTTRGIKVKLRIGSKSYYFLFDSGASDNFISAQLAKDLKEQGLISQYMDNDNYVMANGDTIECRRAIVNNIQIGEFLVDSTVVAIYDKDIEYLLGKSFLANFSSWSMSNANDHLILRK